jgi:rRNA methylases
LASAISTINPDGIAALVEISEIPNYQFNRKDDFVLVLDRIQDPGNMGNLFRTALAAGVNAIFLAGGAHPLGQKVLRASSGAVFHLPFLRFDGIEEEILNSLLKTLSELSNVGFKIFSTSSHNESSKKPSKPYWEVDWSRPTALILGNEGQGIHKKIQEAFNETITIPHSEIVESLNVACVAVPLLLERKRVAYTSK